RAVNFVTGIRPNSVVTCREAPRVFLKSPGLLSRCRKNDNCMECAQMSKLFAFLKDESGATAIEYGLIAAGISVVIIATVNAIGSTLNTKFNSISTQLK